MTNELKELYTPSHSPPLPPGEEETHKTKGWTPERRAAQAARMRARKPWLKSTGPRTAAGKRACKLNGLKHGHRSAQMQKLLKLLAAQKRFVTQWRAGHYHPPKRRFLTPFNQALSLFPYSEQQKRKRREESEYAPRRPTPG